MVPYDNLCKGSTIQMPFVDVLVSKELKENLSEMQEGWVRCPRRV